MILEDLHDVRDSGSLLTNSNVDAVKPLRVSRVGVVEGGLLVDDGIDGDSSFAGLSVSNDKLSLASANGDLLIYNLLIKDSSGANCLLLYK